VPVVPGLIEHLGQGGQIQARFGEWPQRVLEVFLLVPVPVIFVQAKKILQFTNRFVQGFIERGTMMTPNILNRL
jgi:hypothetical protein